MDLQGRRHRSDTASTSMAPQAAPIQHAAGHTSARAVSLRHTQPSPATQGAISNQQSYSPRTPIVIKNLLPYLARYPLTNDSRLLSDGFLYGYRLGYTGESLPGRMASNLSSIHCNKQLAKQKIVEEVTAGRVAGPFKQPPLHNLVCSPIGLVPKSSGGKYRLIHHLSWPRAGHSINDGIDPDAARVTYSRFDNVIEKIVHTGKGTLLAKVDIKSAFRLLPVHPDDFRLLGFTFDGYYFYDMCMPFGCRSSCAIFERFAKFLNWCVSNDCLEGSGVDHYLDDFILYGKPQTSLCQDLLNRFTVLCQHLGIPLATDKTEGPTTVIKFLGLLIDTVRMQVRVPQEKITKTQVLLDNLISYRKVSLRCMQSIIGSLNFLCRAIRPGRVFIQRMVALTRGVRKPYYKLRITKGVKLDAIMWKHFLSEFNGTAAFLSTAWCDNATLHFYTDASITLGYGAYFNGQWFRGKWPKQTHNWSIAVCELFPIVLGIITWGELMKDKKLLIFCDNKAVTHILNKQSSKCPKIMTLMRILTLSCLRYNILLRSMFIFSFTNQAADALSRNQIKRFRQVAPTAQQTPTPTPCARALLCELKSAA